MKYPVSFGRHLLLERINVGGMAEVFKAKSFGVEGFERIVAVKRILPTMAEDDEFVTMFVDEARIASHLTHQNIVQIYELGRHEGAYFISMEYVAGRDLRQILDHHKRLKKPMDVAKACYVTSRVCEALEYAHKKKDPAGKDLKIIHRDVSPQNVIISFEGEVKLCDFGIAKAASRVSRTQVGVLKGKFAYMSPEQVRGQATDRRSDLFALGVIFYEMLTGERLFLGESDYSTLEAVRNARVPVPTQYNAKIPATLEKIMLRLLSRDPKDRYQWASEVHEDLLDHLVQDGKIYHGRHLRTWMQEVYARDIEIENAKLEDFMKLKLPEARSDTPLDPSPSPLVMALAAENAKRGPMDPAMGIPTYAPASRGASNDSGELEQVARTDASITDNSQPKPRLGHSAAKPPAGESPVPEIASQSPVSNLFGTPKLDDDEDLPELEEEPDEEPAIVRATEDSDPKPHFAPHQVDDTFIPPQTLENEESPIGDSIESEMERTQFDVLNVDGNDTVYDPNEAKDDEEEDAEDSETLSGDGLEDEIRAAQSELIDRLDAAGALDGGETVDAGEDSEEYVSPYVFDPSESSVTSEQRIPGSGPKVQAPAISDPGAMDDKTSVALTPPHEDTPMEGTELPPSRRGSSNVEELEYEFEEGTIDASHTKPEFGVGFAEPHPEDVVDARGRSIPPAPPERTRSSVPRRSSPAPRVKKSRTNGASESIAAREPAREIRGPAAANNKRRIWEIRTEGTPPPPSYDGPMPGARAPSPPAPPMPVPANGHESTGARSMPLAEEEMPLLRGRTPVSGLTLRDPRVLMLIAAAVGMLAIALLITLLVARSGTEASLHIVTEPVREVEVRLDGKIIGLATPVEAPSIELGMHTVELRANGYHAYTQVVQISEPKPHTMVVPLEPIDPKEEKRESPPPKRETEQPKTEKTQPVDSSQARPRTETVPDVAQPAKPKTAGVEEKKDVELKTAPKPRTAPVEEGYLLVSTKPTGLVVWIDGKKTNLRTPIRTPHPVTAGKHEIAFEMDDGQKYSFEVVVAPGETKKLIKPLR